MFSPFQPITNDPAQMPLQCGYYACDDLLNGRKNRSQIRISPLDFRI
jgi:hypothetical protein